MLRFLIGIISILLHRPKKLTLSMSTKQGINFILDSAQDPQNISFLVGNKNNPAAQSILTSEDNPTIAQVD